MNSMRTDLSRNKLMVITPILLFGVLFIWWIILQTMSLDSSKTMRQVWGATYQILALYGGVVGLYIARKWDGSKSLIGKIILVFSFGLLLQVFGQTYGSYYVYRFGGEAPPYPGIGDIGFFGSVIAYMYGTVLLARVSGLRNKVIVKNKVLVVMIPVVTILISYMYFLRGYVADWTHGLTVVLDFAYPLGQAFYVGLVILALIFSQKALRGIMKKPILFLLIALLCQYFSDSYFLVLAHQGKWYVGNINDLLYSVSYFIMAIAILSLGSAFETIRES